MKEGKSPVKKLADNAMQTGVRQSRQSGFRFYGDALDYKCWQLDFGGQISWLRKML